MQLSALIKEYSQPGLWQTQSWQSRAVLQQPAWPSESALLQVLSKLEAYPGLVGAFEVEVLKQQIAEAGLGRRFILQAGDCAERFIDCREDIIRSKLRILLQMALVMGYAGGCPIVPIGRMAGQYAKPRSQQFEVSKDGLCLPIFRGELINGFSADFEARKANPDRLLQAYHASSATLNFIRMLMGSGFGDFRQIDSWDFSDFWRGPHWKRYKKIADGLRDTLAFISRVSDASTDGPGKTTGFKDFFVSHEALVLPYEAALTRFVSDMGRHYNLGSHMLWIGDRTRDLEGAHVEYCRGIGNPIGIKVSSETNPLELVEIVSRINPHNEPGKISLISRLGSENVANKLPMLIKALQYSGQFVTWIVDPMHGNTVLTRDGRKTRRYEDLVKEIQVTFEVHKAENSNLGGVHLELTADDVTECTGGSVNITDDQLATRYETWCDPRLNGSQSLEIAFEVAASLRAGQRIH